MFVERIHRVRLLLSAVILTACLAALAWRLSVIQVEEHDKYRQSATRMHSALEPIPAYRGTVRLRDGVIVARDVLDHEVGLDPKFLSEDKLQQVVRLVCDSMAKPPEYRRERLRAALERKQAGGSYVHLVSAVSDGTVAELRNALSRWLTGEEIRALVTRPQVHRVYPRETLACSVVGVVDAGHRGIEGIERAMQSYLSGRDGRREVLLDATRRTRIFNPESAEVPPAGGFDVHLTIDSRMQAIVESELRAGVLREKAEAGSLVLMDCNTGDILAMASYPDYDPNRFSDYPKSERERRRANLVTEALYEPGSVIKPFLAACAIEKGVCRRDQLVRDLMPESVVWDGGIRARFGPRTVRDVHEHENLTLERSIVYSSNICLAIVGLRLGRTGLVDMLDRFGFCRPTGIDLPAEAAGKYTEAKDWKPMYSSVSVSFGYEVMISPLQLCRALSALVNGGYLLRPRIIEKITRGTEEKVYPPRQIEGRPISEATSRHMREILHQVIEEGTGKYLRIEGFAFGGKTGTADMARGGYNKSNYLASFEAFAPFEDPRYVALCMIEKPRGRSYYGAMVAGPIVAEVFRRVFQLKEETKLTIVRRAAGY